jgi:hypothetical protein
VKQLVFFGEYTIKRTDKKVQQIASKKVTGFCLIPNIATFLPKSFSFSTVISTVPSKEENHGQNISSIT